jgi:hypothetical protein
LGRPQVLSLDVVTFKGERSTGLIITSETSGRRAGAAENRYALAASRCLVAAAVSLEAAIGDSCAACATHGDDEPLVIGQTHAKVPLTVLFFPDAIR